MSSELRNGYKSQLDPPQPFAGKGRKSAPLPPVPAKERAKVVFAYDSDSDKPVFADETDQEDGDLEDTEEEEGNDSDVVVVELPKPFAVSGASSKQHPSASQMVIGRARKSGAAVHPPSAAIQPSIATSPSAPPRLKSSPAARATRRRHLHPPPPEITSSSEALRRALSDANLESQTAVSHIVGEGTEAEAKEGNIRSFTKSKTFNVRVFSVELGDLDPQIPDRIRGDVQLRLTSRKQVPNGEAEPKLQSWAERFYSVTLARSQSRPSRLEVLTPGSAQTLVFSPLLSQAQFPSSLQLSFRVLLSLPSTSNTPALVINTEFDVVCSSQFIPRGSSVVSHERGQQTGRLGVEWEISSNLIPVMKEEVSTASLRNKVAREVLESSLRASERESRRDTASRMLDLFEEESKSVTPFPDYSAFPLPEIPVPFTASTIASTQNSSPTPKELPKSQTSPTFHPSPPYDHVWWVARGVPHEYSLLESYPVTMHWDRPLGDAGKDEDRMKVEEFIESCQDVEFDDDVEVSASQMKLARREQLEDYVDLNAFNRFEPTIVRRDFVALQDLITSADFPISYLNQSRWNLSEEQLNSTGDEETKKIDVKLLSLLELFQSRVGLTAAEVIYLHDLICPTALLFDMKRKVEVLPKMPADRAMSMCTFCGAYNCRVHSLDQGSAYNFPPGRVYEEDGEDEEIPCERGCHLLPSENELKDWHVSDLQALRQICAEFPTASSCSIALELNKPCFEVEIYRGAHDLEQRANPQLERSRSPLAKNVKTHRTPWIAKTPGYTPCHHPGLSCSAAGNRQQCSCVVNQTRCNHACDCDVNCTRRMRGCVCKGPCGPNCECFRSHHECDVVLCGCNPEVCKNDEMSLSQTKATAPCDSEVPGGGFGLILLERAKKDDYLLTYAGEVISNRANLSKAWEELPQRSLVSYEFGLNKSHTIDSVHIGGQGRFMNHSVADEDDESGWNGGQKRRTPNTVTRHSAVHQTHQVAFHAMNSLAAGTELTFNYGPEYPQEWK